MENQVLLALKKNVLSCHTDFLVEMIGRAKGKPQENVFQSMLNYIISENKVMSAEQINKMNETLNREKAKRSASRDNKNRNAISERESEPVPRNFSQYQTPHENSQNFGGPSYGRHISRDPRLNKPVEPHSKAPQIESRGKHYGGITSGKNSEPSFRDSPESHYSRRRETDFTQKRPRSRSRSYFSAQNTASRSPTRDGSRNDRSPMRGRSKPPVERSPRRELSRGLSRPPTTISPRRELSRGRSRPPITISPRRELSCGRSRPPTTRSPPPYPSTSNAFKRNHVKSSPPHPALKPRFHDPRSQSRDPNPHRFERSKSKGPFQVTSRDKFVRDRSRHKSTPRFASMARTADFEPKQQFLSESMLTHHEKSQPFQQFKTVEKPSYTNSFAPNPRSRRMSCYEPSTDNTVSAPIAPVKIRQRRLSCYQPSTDEAVSAPIASITSAKIKQRRMSCYQPSTDEAVSAPITSTKIRQRRMSVHHSSGYQKHSSPGVSAHPKYVNPKSIETGQKQTRKPRDFNTPCPLNKKPRLDSPSSTYRIPKLNRTSETITSSSPSHDLKSLHTNGTSVIDKLKELPKVADKPEELVKNLEKILGTENFLKIKHQLIQENIGLTSPVIPDQNQEKTIKSKIAIEQKSSSEKNASNDKTSLEDKVGTPAEQSEKNDSVSNRKEIPEPSTSTVSSSKHELKTNEKPLSNEKIQKVPPEADKTVKTSSAKPSHKKHAIKKKIKNPTSSVKVQSQAKTDTAAPIKNKTPMRKTLTELEKLQLDNANNCGEIANAFLPRRCTTKHKSYAEKDQTYYEKYELKEMKVVLQNLSFKGLKMPIKINQQLVQNYPNLKPAFETYFFKDIVESDIDLKCDEDIDWEAEPDPLEETSSDKVSSQLKISLRNMAHARKRRTWSRGMIVKKAKKVKNDTLDDELTSKSIQDNTAKINLMRLMELMDLYEMKILQKSEQEKIVESKLNPLQTLPVPINSTEAVNNLPNTKTDSKCGPTEANKPYKEHFLIINTPNGRLLQCQNCLFKSTDPQSFIQHLKSSHSNISWNKFCNKCDETISAAGSTLLSAFYHMLTHAQPEEGQAKGKKLLPQATIFKGFVNIKNPLASEATTKQLQTLKVRPLPGDKLSTRISPPATQLELLEPPKEKYEPPFKSISFGSAPMKYKVNLSAIQTFSQKSPSVATQQAEATALATSGTFQQPFTSKTLSKATTLPAKTPLHSSDSLRPWIKNAVNLKSQYLCNEMLTRKCLAALFKCMGSNCSIYTSDRALFLRHLEHHEHFMKDTFSSCLRCSYCNHVAKTKGNLIDHICQTHGFDSYQCGFCFYRAFSNIYVAQHHHEIYHKEEPKNTLIYCEPLSVMDKKEKLKEIGRNLDQVVPPFKCIFCNLTFFLTEPFKLHMKSHDTSKTLKCLSCKELINSRSLMSHYFDCFGFGNYQCAYCRFGTSDIKIMRDHIAVNHSNCIPIFCNRFIKNVDPTRVNLASVSSMAVQELAAAPFISQLNMIKYPNIDLRNEESIARFGRTFSLDSSDKTLDASSISHQLPESSFIIDDNQLPSTSGIKIDNVFSLSEFQADPGPFETFEADCFDDLMTDFSC